MASQNLFMVDQLKKKALKRKSCVKFLMVSAKTIAMVLLIVAVAFDYYKFLGG